MRCSSGDKDTCNGNDGVDIALAQAPFTEAEKIKFLRLIVNGLIVFSARLFFPSSRVWHR